MKTTKIFKILIAFAFLAFLIAYLFGAFYEVSFDIAKWQKDTRSVVIGVPCLLFFLMFFARGMLLLHEIEHRHKESSHLTNNNTTT